MYEDIWSEIKLKYESTETSYAKLSKEYGFSKNAIANRSRKEGWKKFKKLKEEIHRKAREEFILESEVTVKDLMLKEDETLARFQEVVDGEVPYQEIFSNIENLSGDLIVKIDGTIKGIVETTLLIGNKRRELRGVLPLKERELVRLKEEELQHKKDMDYKKYLLEKERSDLELLIKKATNKRLLRRAKENGVK